MAAVGEVGEVRWGEDAVDCLLSRYGCLLAEWDVVVWGAAGCDVAEFLFAVLEWSHGFEFGEDFEFVFCVFVKWSITVPGFLVAGRVGVVRKGR